MNSKLIRSHHLSEHAIPATPPRPAGLNQHPDAAFQSIKHWVWAFTHTASASAGPPSFSWGHHHVPRQPPLPTHCSGYPLCCSYEDPLKGRQPSPHPSIKYSNCSPQPSGQDQAHEQLPGPCEAQPLLSPPVPLRPHPCHTLHASPTRATSRGCSSQAPKFYTRCILCAWNPLPLPSLTALSTPSLDDGPHGPPPCSQSLHARAVSAVWSTAPGQPLAEPWGHCSPATGPHACQSPGPGRGAFPSTPRAGMAPVLYEVLSEHLYEERLTQPLWLLLCQLQIPS